MEESVNKTRMEKILKEEIELWTGLVKLAEQKTVAISKKDIDAINFIMVREQDSMDKIAKLQKAMKDEHQEVKFLKELLADRESVIEKLIKLNDKNKMLLQGELKIINGVLAEICKKVKGSADEIGQGMSIIDTVV